MINFSQFKIKEDRAILLACIGIAFVFWLLVKLSQPYRAQKQVYIIAAIDENVAFAKLPPNNIAAEIEGTGWDLMFDFFNRSSVRLYFDLTNSTNLNLSAGQLRAAIKQNLSSTDLKVIDVNYDNINLKLEQRVDRKLPVRVKDSLTFADEYQLMEKISVTPDTVMLSGPYSLVTPLEYWPTLPIILDQLNASVTKIVDLEPVPDEIKISNQTATVAINVEPFTEKTMYVPIDVINAPDSLKIFPDKVTVACKLGLSKYDQVSYRDFRAEVDLKDISLNTPHNTVPIVLKKSPSFVKGLYHTPKSAKFFIVEQEQ
jgi:hypothetical protein